MKSQESDMRWPLFSAFLLLFIALTLPSAFAEDEPTRTTTTSTDSCPSDTQLSDDTARCQREGGNPVRYESGTCTKVRCDIIKDTRVTEASCPDVTADKMACERQGLSAELSRGRDGCAVVTCVRAPISAEKPAIVPVSVKPGDATTCSKSVDANGCVHVRCADGYTHNSCRSDACTTERVTCRVVQEGSCSVQYCSDGTSERRCANDEVTCRAVRDENGCVYRSCSDGTMSEPQCPQEQSCREHRDERGCTITECNDGTKTRTCPNVARGFELECSVYRDENGCAIRECSNGLRTSSCEQQQCRTTTDGACTITSCADGSVSRTCDDAEEVTCRSVRDEQGCVATRCSDGFSSVQCPRDSLPSIAAASLESVAPRPGFFARVFGRG